MSWPKAALVPPLRTTSSFHWALLGLGHRLARTTLLCCWDHNIWKRGSLLRMFSLSIFLLDTGKTKCNLNENK